MPSEDGCGRGARPGRRMPPCRVPPRTCPRASRHGPASPPCPSTEGSSSPFLPRPGLLLLLGGPLSRSTHLALLLLPIPVVRPPHLVPISSTHQYIPFSPTKRSASSRTLREPGDPQLPRFARCYYPPGPPLNAPPLARDRWQVP